MDDVPRREHDGCQEEDDEEDRCEEDDEEGREEGQEVASRASVA
jgi:hypothetical protein